MRRAFPADVAGGWPRAKRQVRQRQPIRPDYVPVWLRKAVPALYDDKPLDVIAAGHYRRVAELISGLEDPGAGQARCRRNFSGTAAERPVL